ncbi:hypothetical protein [Burkholderia cepacia]|uniref:hypothetical protein n=1 Tax=Burkholderia cepacia TaxID=292 RepID=UPI00158B6E64|nr:hypothetical protein [Burkholderia cepacia]
MKNLFCAAILALCATACHNSTDGTDNTDSIVGTYGVEDHGKVEPFVKVDVKDGKYTLSEFHSGTWVPTKGDLRPFTKADLESFTKKKVDVPVDGIYNSAFALIHVPKGWTDGSLTSKTGYFAIVLFVPVELEKL